MFGKLKEKEALFFAVIFIILVSFRIWLITGIPKMLIYGPHDDLFFAKAAHYIIHGQWMGPYDQMTSIKAPFYSFFLVISFLGGLPLLITETVFYVMACLVLFYAFSPLIESRWIRMLLFMLVLFAPASLTIYSNMIVRRDFVYFSLSLFVVAFSIGLFLRLEEKLSNFLLWLVGLGIFMGAFMITREEGVWIYPMLFLLFLVYLFNLWRGNTDQKWARSLLLILPILIWQIPSLMVSYLNYSHYGFWGITEQLDPDFNRVLSVLDRIETNDTWHPAIQIPRQARMEAYKASPILNEMKDSIEQDLEIWNAHDDYSMSIKPEWYLSQYGDGGTEVGNGHFMWLLRDIIAKQGYYSSGKYPRDFYDKTADQIEEACNNGKLKCSSPKNIPLIGAINQQHYPIILRMFYEGTFHILKYNYLNLISLDIRTWPRWPANHNEYKYFQEFVNDSLYGPGIHPELENPNQYLVYGKTDIRLKMNTFKEKIILRIAEIYRGFTLPMFLIGFATWLFLLLYKLFRSQIGINVKNFWISNFVLGLFVSRLMLLAVLDATTSVGGIYFYNSTTYIFIHIFSFLMIYWILEQPLMMYQSRRSL